MHGPVSREMIDMSRDAKRDRRVNFRINSRGDVVGSVNLFLTCTICDPDSHRIACAISF